MAAQQSTQTSVYLYFDALETLIYVGITGRGARRQREHNADKAWWPYVHHQSVEHYASRQEALDREAALIRRHSPPFNTVHNPMPHLLGAYQDSARTSDVHDAPGKRLAMSVAVTSERSVVLLTDPADAALSHRIDISGPFVIGAARRKVNTAELVRVGPLVAAYIEVKNGAAAFDTASLMYRIDEGRRSIKRIDLRIAAEVTAPRNRERMPRGAA